MKFDPSQLAATAKAWIAKHGKFVFPGFVAVFALAVIVVNIRPHFAHGSDSPKVSAPTVAVPSNVAPATKVIQAAGAIPHIAQRPATPIATPPTAAVTAAAPVPVAAPIQPPVGIERGYVLQKKFQQAQFGLAQTSADVVSVQTLSVQADATDGDGERATEWSAWFNLTKPTTIAWVRLAGGEGTVAVTIDGTSLGEAVDHWQTQGAISNLASVPLAAGWHQITINDARRSWVKGPGVAVRIDLGDGTGATVSPQPWAVPLDAQPAEVVPRNACPHGLCAPSIAQQPAAPSASTASAPGASASPVMRARTSPARPASRNNPAVSAASTTAGASK